MVHVLSSIFILCLAIMTVSGNSTQLRTECDESTGVGCDPDDKNLKELPTKVVAELKGKKSSRIFNRTWYDDDGTIKWPTNRSFQPIK